MSGRIVQRTATSVEVDVGAGKVTVPADRVERIEERRSPLDDYYDRAWRLAARDVAGWQALGAWASDQGLSAQAREAYTRVLAMLPDDARRTARWAACRSTAAGWPRRRATGPAASSSSTASG